jgi:uncharacterized protein YnzC (UPF0291/DUF896 family)
MDNLLKRINELYHKSQKTPLTRREKAEQDRLRKQYVKQVRKSVIHQLNNITIEEEDGSFNILSEKGIKE